MSDDFALLLNMFCSLTRDKVIQIDDMPDYIWFDKIPNHRMQRFKQGNVERTRENILNIFSVQIFCFNRNMKYDLDCQSDRFNSKSTP